MYSICNIAINRIFPEILGYISLIGLIVSKAPEFGEITQNNSHYAVQGHSRLPILVPIESSRRVVNNTYLVSFPSYCGILVKFSLSTEGVLLFIYLFLYKQKGTKTTYIAVKITRLKYR